MCVTAFSQRQVGLTRRRRRRRRRQSDEDEGRVESVKGEDVEERQVEDDKDDDDDKGTDNLSTVSSAEDSGQGSVNP